MAVSYFSIAGRVQFRRGTNNDRYSAPELHWPRGVGEILTSEESDVYGMGMVIYEVISPNPASSCIRVEFHVDLLGLDGGQTILWLRRYRCRVKGAGR